MKVPAFLIAGVSLASAADLTPAYHFEDTAATDGSTQRCLVFTTVPGVHYRVEMSDDCSLWSTASDIYELGQKVTTSLCEMAPPPGGAPSGPPAGSSEVSVSLLFQRSNAAAGGTIVFWNSLNDGTPRVVLISETLDPGWFTFPLLSQRIGGYNFTLLAPQGSATPPMENSSLGTLDAAMIAQLESSFASLNSIAANPSTFTSPLPLPAATSDHKFFRIFADWGIDSDGDGSPDWLELAMMNDPSHPFHNLANPLVADVDGDGNPDGTQLDYDGDGVVDLLDSSPTDPAVKVEKAPL